MDKFSVQYLAMITIFPICGLLFLKNLKVLVLISAYGVYAIYAYLIFIVYIMIDNLTNGTEVFQDMTVFSFDIGNLAGASAMALNTHMWMGKVIK